MWHIHSLTHGEGWVFHSVELSAEHTIIMEITRLKLRTLQFVRSLRMISILTE